MADVNAILIDDSTLINNFYKILAHEYGFDEVFKKIGVSAKFDFDSDDIKKINEWLNDSSTGADPKVNLIKQFEDFRAISKDPEKFEEQIKLVADLYESIIEVFDFTKKYNLKFLDYKENLNYVKNSQDFTFQLEYFRRDNLVHPLRVFLLGCYIIYADEEFWIYRTLESVKKDIPWTSHVLFSHIYILELSQQKDFLLKSVFLIWMISSLFHDIGRSIEDAKIVINDITKTYASLPNFSWGCKKISNGNEGFSGIELSCLAVQPNEIGSRKIGALIKFLKMVRAEKRNFIKAKIETKIKDLDHGAISAVLSTDYNYLEENELNFFQPVFSDKSVPFLIYLFVHYSFISISLHDNKRYFFVSPLTQLLVATDILQEWNRITKIGDIKRKICPCERIELKFYNSDGSKGKILEVIIPYEKPEDDLIKEIFDRRDKEHNDLVEELANSQDEIEIFNKFFDKGVEVRIGYLEDEKNEILKLKICGFCGYITSKEDKPTKDFNNLTCSNARCESYGRT